MTCYLFAYWQSQNLIQDFLQRSLQNFMFGVRSRNNYLGMLIFERFTLLAKAVISLQLTALQIVGCWVRKHWEAKGFAVGVTPARV